MRTRIWASIVVVAFVVPLLAAQVEFGAITGLVTDASGAVLPGVRIELTGPQKRTVVTNGRGEFTIAKLQPGEYAVTAVLPGFTIVRTPVVLAAGRTEKLTIEMHVGAVEETISVTAETPTVDTRSVARNSVAGGVVGGVVGAAIAPPPPGRRVDGFNTEAYDYIEENRFRSVNADPLSTYRRLRRRQRPRAAVHIG